MNEPPAQPGTRTRWAWTGAAVVVAALVLVGSEAKGIGSRRFFEPPPEFGGRRWGLVRDAADAVRAWAAAGVYGRRLVVLTGRWAPIRSSYLDRRIAENPSAKDPTDLVDEQSALLFSSRTGLAREIIVVMPPAALGRRLAEIAAGKEFQREGGCASLPFHGFSRRFCAPEAVGSSDEPVLLLIEPSFFAEGAPGLPDAWLRERGLVADLALVAGWDPVASEAQAERALAFARGVNAVDVGVER